ncbi:rRNA biogenesis protein rrp36 [Thalictrum thalictroides]|uniref:rRNA biogenesis protein RRP36 n=1 Tax=Thalictrum thalictroides TaxID=46969 RepID=A0A7J6XDV9_THATH|nr:rRNA biogenesis protein rrp36 [Thalictrum thalictroides]
MGIQNSESLISFSSKIKFEESETDESEYFSEEEEIRRELADVSFEELQKARSNGFHALCLKSKDEKKGRINKNRPSEISSKKPVTRFREVLQVPKKVTRDPRFESLCGTLDTDGFKKRYSFLYESQLPAEKEELKKLLRKSKDPDSIADLKNRISLIDKQLKEGPSKFAVDKAILAEHKRKERETTKQGKRPFYLKQSEIREKALIEKYNRLKAAGKLESFIEKKRKKNASKDHRFMPYRRPSNGN